VNKETRQELQVSAVSQEWGRAARADDLMYRAKREGRNRVVG
jgi:PleD family two-component response regulator